jgi:hypothetical protein
MERYGWKRTRKGSQQSTGLRGGGLKKEQRNQNYTAEILQNFVFNFEMQVKQSLYWPLHVLLYRRLKIPHCETFGTLSWYGCQPFTPAAFTLQEVTLVPISVRG